MSCLLGLDIGTTSTIGILIDTAGGVLATASRPNALVSRHANWAEEDTELWWSNVCDLVPDLLRIARLEAGAIAAVGVTGMVPTVILLDGAGRPLRPSIQQNDARAVDEIEELKRLVDGDDWFPAHWRQHQSAGRGAQASLARASRARMLRPGEDRDGVPTTTSRSG